MRLFPLLLSASMALALTGGCLNFGGEGDDNNTTPDDDNDGFGVGGNFSANVTANNTSGNNTTGDQEPVETLPDVVLEVTMRDVAAGGWRIDPNTISAIVGDNVSLVVTAHANNLPGSNYAFQIEGYELETEPLGPGEQEYLNFTADQAGTFAYWGGGNNERTLGMEGEMTISE